MHALLRKGTENNIEKFKDIANRQGHKAIDVAENNRNYLDFIYQHLKSENNSDIIDSFFPYVNIPAIHIKKSRN